MNHLFPCAMRAAKSLMQPALLKVLLVSIAINAAVLVLLAFVMFQLIMALPFVSDSGWLADAGASIIATTLSFMLFPILLPLILFLFNSSMVERIEQAEYPNLPPVVPPLWPSLAQDALFVAKALALNIVVLPLYLVPGLNLVLYYLLNGYLLSSEIFNLVAGRHLHRDAAKTLRRENGNIFFFGGVIFAFLLTVPLVNLIAPLWGVALIVHLFHSKNPPYKAEILAPEPANNV